MSRSRSRLFHPSLFSPQQKFHSRRSPSRSWRHHARGGRESRARAEPRLSRPSPSRTCSARWWCQSRPRGSSSRFRLEPGGWREGSARGRDATRDGTVASFGSQRVRSREATKRRRAGAARETTRRRLKSLAACLEYDVEHAARVSPTDGGRARDHPAAPVARATRVDSLFSSQRGNQKWRFRTRGSASAVADANVPRPRGDAVPRRLRPSRRGPRRGYPRG